MDNTIGEEYFSIKEVANKLKVSYVTVYRWVESGSLKSVKAGKQHRIKAEDLESFLEKSKE